MHHAKDSPVDESHPLSIRAAVSTSRRTSDAELNRINEETAAAIKAAVARRKQAREEAESAQLQQRLAKIRRPNRGAS
jgi:hypothetical protein